MATKVRLRSSAKSKIRFKRRLRIRGSVNGTEARPRLAVFRSNRHLYVQLINDVTRKTLVSASTAESVAQSAKNLEGAKAVGDLVAKRALAQGIQSVVFDRSGYLYHGKVKALADAARAGGLSF